MLRERAAYELNQLRILNFQLMIEATGTILSYLDNGDPSEATTNAEDLSREARVHARRHLQILEEIEFYTGERAEAERRLQARLNNMRIERRNYSVYNSDGTVSVPIYQSPQPSKDDDAQPAQTPCHEESYYPIEKVVDAGFDEQGNPRREWHYDVVKRTSKVCE
jgi:ATP/maltotriose-dependent transcriptional regulator MalT